MDDDHVNEFQMLVSYVITNRSWIHSPSPSPPVVLEIFFKFSFKFEDDKWVDQDSLVLIGRPDAPVRSSAHAHAAVDKLSFTKIRDSIEKVLERLGVQDRCRDQLIAFAWDDVHELFGTKPITATGIKGYVIDIEVVVKRRCVSVAGCLRGSSCSICLEDFSGSRGWPQLLRLPCSHFFHRRCIDKWLRVRRRKSRCCPLCRHKVDISVLLRRRRFLRGATS